MQLDKHKQTEKIKIAYLQICNTVGPLVFRFSLHGLYLPDQVDGKYLSKDGKYLSKSDGRYDADLLIWILC